MRRGCGVDARWLRFLGLVSVLYAGFLVARLSDLHSHCALPLNTLCVLAGWVSKLVVQRGEEVLINYADRTSDDSMATWGFHTGIAMLLAAALCHCIQLSHSAPLPLMANFVGRSW